MAKQKPAPKPTAALLRFRAQEAARKAAKGKAPPPPKPPRKPLPAKPPKPTVRPNVAVANIPAKKAARTAPPAATPGKVAPAARSGSQALLELERERVKRHPFAAAGSAVSTATQDHAANSTGKPATVPAPVTTERVPPHRSYNTELPMGTRHPRPWRVGGGPDDHILSWIIYDAKGHPVACMPFVYSNEKSLRREADYIVDMVNNGSEV